LIQKFWKKREKSGWRSCIDFAGCDSRRAERTGDE